VVVSRRCIGLDVHRDFAQVAVWEAGIVRQVGQIQTTPEALRLFADSLAASDEIALEATSSLDTVLIAAVPHVLGGLVRTRHARNASGRGGRTAASTSTDYGSAPRRLEVDELTS
jgi:hypothetical protein